MNIKFIYLIIIALAAILAGYLIPLTVLDNYYQYLAPIILAIVTALIGKKRKWNIFEIALFIVIIFVLWLFSAMFFAFSRSLPCC